MEKEQRLYWFCVSCHHSWEDEGDKHHKNCIKCNSAFIMDWLIEKEKEE